MAVEDALTRLAALQGSDPGVFVLAVHAFIEGYLRSLYVPADPADDSFYAYLEEFRSDLLSKARGYVQGLDSLAQIKNQHHLTNDVRHRFAAAAVEDARAATQNLLRFCELAGVRSETALVQVAGYLKAWEDRRSRGELLKELSDMGYRFHMERKSGKERMERLAALEKIETEAAHLRVELERRDRELAQLSEVKDRKDERINTLRVERTALAAELKVAKAKEKELEDVREYLDLLTRLTVLTRTRADYERSIIRLTAEQKQVLSQIRLDKDFLIKGAAGTGKTLVLLKAIEKAKGRGVATGSVQDELDLEELQGSVALLTYTKTLVKYDQYMVSLLMNGEMVGRVATADAFLNERLRELDPAYTVDYRLPEELAKSYPAAGLGPGELAAEIENFIWGNDISYEEYVIEGIDRRGMKRPLVKDQRMAVWTSAEAMEAQMEKNKVFTRNRAAILISRAIAAGQGKGITRYDHIFIDEAQDLPAAVLKAFKACSARSVILSGDSDQSIYQPGFSFKRAGLIIAGRSRVLRTNFRNTVQLHTLAERYRKSIAGNDEENQPEAFREGPEPELFMGSDSPELMDLLVQRMAVYLEVLGYAPENLCVIVPREEDLKRVRQALSDSGLEVADIRENAFRFQGNQSVRITTMHSAKGLDFPVVLLFLPQFHVMNGSLDPATIDRMARNLIYVAMTRAMDHLSVFIREGTDNPALLDLAACFEVKA